MSNIFKVNVKVNILKYRDGTAWWWLRMIIDDDGFTLCKSF